MQTEGSKLELFVRDAWGVGDGLLVLYVLSADGSRMPCHRYPVGADVDDAYRETCESIEERALRQANTLGGAHNFVLEWQRTDAEGRTRIEGHEVFRVAAEAAPGGQFLSEPPNEGGLVAQAMRHQETNQRIVVQAMDRAMFHMTKTLDRVAHRAEVVEDRYMASMGAFLDSIAAKNQHEVEMVKAQGNADIKRAMASRVANLLPVVAGRALEHFGKSGTPARLRGFFSSLSQQQVGALLQQLQPEQQALLLEIAKPIIEEMERENSEAEGNEVH